MVGWVRVGGRVGGGGVKVGRGGSGRVDGVGWVGVGGGRVGGGGVG